MQWQKRLYNDEEQPPEQVWENVKNEISVDPMILRQKLDAMEATPPEEAWNAIRSSIAETADPSLQAAPAASAETLPHLIRFKRAYNYAAVIAGTLLVISGLLYLINTRETAPGSTDLATSIIRSDSPSTSPAIPLSGLPVGTSFKPSIVLTDGNYMRVSSPEGGYSRVSYKFQPMIHTMYGNISSPDSVRVQWNQLINNWREQIGQSSFVPSAGNFFDLAGMLELMDDATASSH